ncbi:hypothetical protein FGB62_105g01 [Gracilaria domingensis]|nr:hypothetical protein FGB62_105g01 [Gracilaria domingensis]
MGNADDASASRDDAAEGMSALNSRRVGKRMFCADSRAVSQLGSVQFDAALAAAEEEEEEGTCCCHHW